MELADFDGCDSLENPLTQVSQPKRKRGRPPKIDDEMLRRAQGELLFVLEQNWALIGWDLQQAETTSDLQAAFERIQGINCRNLDNFRLNFQRGTPLRQLQATRKRLEEVSRKLREAQFNWQQSKEDTNLARAACRTDSNSPELQRLYSHSQAAESLCSEAFKQLQSRSAKLEKTLVDQEAAFSQSELLDFIQSDRYASTPLSFSNAMAGLPSIRWRQSMSRCNSLKDCAREGITYRRFLIVADVFKIRLDSATEAVAQLRARLIQAEGKDVETLNELAENWYFLRVAIEFILKENRPLHEALPYRIFAEYERRSHSGNPVDILLAQREIITTPRFLKERRRIARLSF